ncbi:hypothetical protein ACFQVD_42910 [Streptosporangium amethystogenes subsp. fukuiense]|uniref:Uncharacterized protein n=1 Tax=Streptosporangium amethystogenes subsp. fukuiense TaxID=698418 RepID=A0ABW2TFS8_9ACTN
MDITASVRTSRPHIEAPCPPWCERAHSTAYVTHAADIAEVRNPDGSTVTVTLSQHLQPGYVGEQVVRVYTRLGEETGIADLSPDSAEAVGRSIVAFSPDGAMRLYGLALQRAAAHLLFGGLEAPRDRGEAAGRAAAESPSQEKLFRIAFLSGYLNATRAPGSLSGGAVERRLSRVLSPRETSELCDIVRGMLSRRTAAGRDVAHDDTCDLASGRYRGRKPEITTPVSAMNPSGRSSRRRPR